MSRKREQKMSTFQRDSIAYVPIFYNALDSPVMVSVVYRISIETLLRVWYMRFVDVTRIRCALRVPG